MQFEKKKKLHWPDSILVPLLAVVVAIYCVPVHKPVSSMYPPTFESGERKTKKYSSHIQQFGSGHMLSENRLSKRNDRLPLTWPFISRGAFFVEELKPFLWSLLLQTNLWDLLPQDKPEWNSLDCFCWHLPYTQQTTDTYLPLAKRLYTRRRV